MKTFQIWKFFCSFVQIAKKQQPSNFLIKILGRIPLSYAFSNIQKIMKKSSDISYEKQVAAEFLKDSVVISFLNHQEFKKNSSEFHMLTEIKFCCRWKQMAAKFLKNSQQNSVVISFLMSFLITKNSRRILVSFICWQKSSFAVCESRWQRNSWKIHISIPIRKGDGFT